MHLTHITFVLKANKNALEQLINERWAEACASEGADALLLLFLGPGCAQCDEV